ncbi:nucleotide exchange factor GrpE [Sporolactobacillus sp. THM7-7]|nr:nucleotide exchange factor GrpE [Sporolactobacillus sp. THM7-7]
MAEQAKGEAKEEKRATEEDRAREEAKQKDAARTEKAQTADKSPEASERTRSGQGASLEEEAGREPDGEALVQKLADQSAKIESLKKANEELNSRWLRAQADFDNFRKRTNKEKAEARKYRAQDLASDMLEILDNFKRALSVETESEDGTALKKGMEMVLKKLEAALKKEGVEEIDSLGKPFDPNLHQAVMQEESEEHESGTVIQVLQAGYTLNGRVIRPAMVKVSA